MNQDPSKSGDLVIEPIDPDIDPSLFLDMNWYNQPKLPGFSFMIRAKNEAQNLTNNIQSIRRFLPKSVPYEIVVINNDSQDQTEAVARSLMNDGDQVVNYPYRIAKPGLENYYTPVDSIHSFVYFTQFSMMKCRREFCFRWDADFEMTEAMGQWLKAIWEDHQLKQKYNACTFGYFMIPAQDKDGIQNSELYLFQTQLDPFYYRHQIWEQIGFFKSTSPDHLNFDMEYMIYNVSSQEALILHQSTLKVTKTSYLEEPWWITKLKIKDSRVWSPSYVQLMEEIETKCQAFQAQIPKDAQTYCRSMDPKPIEVVRNLPFAQTYSQVYEVLQQMRKSDPDNDKYLSRR